MDPIAAAALISGGASLLGGAASSISSAADSRRSMIFTRSENERAREFARWTTAQNFQENNRNRKFQEHMSSSAYQRAVGDMKAAGINPMLAFMKGGADSGSGSSGGATDANTGKNYDQKSTNIGQGLSGAASSALELLRLKNETSMAQASNVAKAAEADLNVANAQSVRAQLPVKKLKGMGAQTILPTVEGISKKIQEILQSTPNKKFDGIDRSHHD